MKRVRKAEKKPVRVVIEESPPPPAPVVVASQEQLDRASAEFTSLSSAVSGLSADLSILLADLKSFKDCGGLNQLSIYPLSNGAFTVYNRFTSEDLRTNFMKRLGTAIEKFYLDEIRASKSKVDELSTRL